MLIFLSLLMVTDDVITNANNPVNKHNNKQQLLRLLFTSKNVIQTGLILFLALACSIRSLSFCTNVSTVSVLFCFFVPEHLLVYSQASVIRDVRFWQSIIYSFASFKNGTCHFLKFFVLVFALLRMTLPQYSLINRIFWWDLD